LKAEDIMRRMPVKLLVAAGLVLCAPTLLTAQSRIAFEGRVGIAIPTGHLGDSYADPGYAVGVELLYNPVSRFTAYAGVSRDRFGCLSGCETAESYGFQGGLKYAITNNGRVQPWLRGGVIGQLLDTSRRSELGVGFEAGAGANIPMSPRFALVPAAFFRNYAAEWDGAQGLTARYFVLGLGGQVHF
jgi:hypothetical protein